MNTRINRTTTRSASYAASLLLLLGTLANATVDGKHVDGFTATGATASMSLLVTSDHATTGDGNAMLIWGLKVTGQTGFSNSTPDLFQRATYPGPTLIVNQGATVTLTLTKDASIPIPVSLVFPGLQVTATQTGTTIGPNGLLTQEASLTTDQVTYKFVASQAGTYYYHGGTRPELATEMGMFGALIVRPSATAPARPQGGVFTGIAFKSSTIDTAWDREYLMLLSEMDPRIHQMIEFQGLAALDRTDYLDNYKPNYFFINGRTGPDTLADPNVLWLPVQPYNSLVRLHPGERVLFREVEAGRDLHPLHQHGQHDHVVGKDGQMLASPGSTYADLAYDVFTTMTIPGQTYDEIFTWTGQFLNWDAYGPDYAHTCNGRTWAQGPQPASNAWTAAPSDFDPVTYEYCPDHGKPIPVALPGIQELRFGDSYSGSPYLGQKGNLPPGQGFNNTAGGYFFMFHSHTERELTNDNIFPGGMLNMIIVEAPWVPIP